MPYSDPGQRNRNPIFPSKQVDIYAIGYCINMKSFPFARLNDTIELMKMLSKFDISYQYQYDEILVLLEQNIDDDLANVILKKHHLYRLNPQQARSLVQLYIVNEAP